MASQVVRARVFDVFVEVMVKGAVRGEEVPLRYSSGVVPVKVFVELQMIS